MMFTPLRVRFLIFALHIDQEYRTINRSAARGICGFSMGGGGAMRLTLKYPDLFGAAASLAASLEQSP